jgi:hypothetical protein
LVEHTTENRGVPGSNPGLAIGALSGRREPFAAPRPRPGLTGQMGGRGRFDLNMVLI